MEGAGLCGHIAAAPSMSETAVRACNFREHAGAAHTLSPPLLQWQRLTAIALWASQESDAAESFKTTFIDHLYPNHDT